MKKLIVLLLAVVMVWGCKENPPEIPALGGGTNSTRKVIVEEFTGVRCVNCPSGSAEIENLLALHGENLIAISIHSGYFSEPYEESQYDFRTDDGDAIASLLGEPEAFPSAVINRKQFANEPLRQVNQQSWAGYIQNELNEEPKLNIALESSFDDASNDADVTVTIVPLTNISGTLGLTVLITESNIVDYQLLPTGKDATYTHKHVFRGLMSPGVNGQALSSLVTGVAQSFTFSKLIPEEWNPDNCHIVAFVHQVGPNFDVLQAEELEMK